MKKFLTIFLLSLTATATWAEKRSIALSIPGMNCPVCPITVRKSLDKLEGIEEVNVEYKNRIATVTFDDTKVDLASITQATRDVGYPSTVHGNR